MFDPGLITLKSQFTVAKVADASVAAAVRAGRKNPVRWLIGPEIWPVFANQNIVPTLPGEPPHYRGIPCYKMRASGIALVTGKPHQQ